MFSDLTKSSPTFAALGAVRGVVGDRTWHSHNTYDCRNRNSIYLKRKINLLSHETPEQLHMTVFFAEETQNKKEAGNEESKKFCSQRSNLFLGELWD